MTASSAGTIPSGLELYMFDYPETFQPVSSTLQWGFFSDHIAATRFAREAGAWRVTHAISGGVVFIQ